MLLKLFESLLSRIKEYFDIERLGAMFGELMIKGILFGIVLTAFYIVWRVFRRLVLPNLENHLDKTSIAFTETLIKYSILSVAIIAALSSAGIKTTALLGSLGVAGLTIGFALRDTLSNIISGILVFMDRPFTIDDLVEIDGNYGRVDRITLRTTRIVTNDGRMLAVPNAEIMNKTVTSYTNFPHLRLDVGVTVGVLEDIDKVRELLLALVLKDPDYMQEPAPSVVVTVLGDYNVEVELRVWLEEERDNVKKRFELREKMYKSLTIEGVDMPFETIQLTPHKVILTK
ncbi:MAG: small conductance mechanosensitive channel [Desulforhopalus sp.]|jgi:small conductance mechanosensitive channel